MMDDRRKVILGVHIESWGGVMIWKILLYQKAAYLSSQVCITNQTANYSYSILPD